MRVTVGTSDENEAFLKALDCGGKLEEVKAEPAPGKEVPKPEPGKKT